jgi:hypothetical protein
MRHYLAVLATALALAACGGGGGGDSSVADPGGNPGTPGGTPDGGAGTTALEFSGVAAKGRIVGATVAVHRIAANGSIEVTPLAQGDAPTDTQGRYRVRFNGTVGQPYVVRIAIPASGALHRDEVTGADQALAPGFTLRAVTLPTKATATVNITPFSEMATSVAALAPVTPERVLQANSTVMQLLGMRGTNLPGVGVVGTKEATDIDQQRLALMMTAVSQMAANGALGCTGDAAARSLCVVQKLGASMASPASMALGGGVATALADAIRTVIQTPALLGNVPPALAASTLAALQCEGVSCVATGAPLVLTPPAGIAAIKQTLTELRSDIVTLFGDPASATRGELEVQNDKFSQAMRGVQAPVEMLAKDTALLLMGADLYNDYKAGRTSQVTRLRGPDEYFGTDKYPSSALYYAGGCSLYQDSATTRVATSTANANFVGCSTRYFVAFQTLTDYSHGFTLTPAATPGSFTYTSRARSRRSGVTTTLAPTAGPASGTLTTALDGNGRITSFSATGALPGAFRTGTNTLVSDSNSWDITGSRTTDAAGQSASISLTGTVTSKDSGGATLGTLQVKSAALGEVPVARDASFNVVAPDHPSAVAQYGSEMGTGSVDLVWRTAAAEFEGIFSATESRWDARKTTHAPTQLTLEGRLAVIDAGVRTEYLTGKLAVTVLGLESYYTGVGDGSGNYVTIAATLNATFTAPTRPLLALTVGSSMKSYQTVPEQSYVQYRSFADGSPRTSINIRVSKPADSTSGDVLLTDVRNQVSMYLNKQVQSNPVYLGFDTIGTYDPVSGIVTFTDGTFMSVGF